VEWQELLGALARGGRESGGTGYPEGGYVFRIEQRDIMIKVSGHGTFEPVRIGVRPNVPDFLSPYRVSVVGICKGRKLVGVDVAAYLAMLLHGPPPNAVISSAAIPRFGRRGAFRRR